VKDYTVGKKRQFGKTTLGKAEKWLVEAAKKAGLDIGDFEHETTNDFVSHVMNRHGNEAIESARSQVAIKSMDFGRIPEIVMDPDYVMVGARRKNEDIVIYAKKMEDGTAFYIEEILRGNHNRTLRGKTMYKRKGNIDEKMFETLAGQNGKTDLTKAKIVVGRGRPFPR